MSLALLALDSDTARQLVVAIRQYRDRYGDEGLSGLIDLQHFATQQLADTSGHLRTPADRSAGSGPPRSYVAGDDHELLTQKQGAAELGISPRTLRRWLDNGDVDGVNVGSRRRVSRQELHRIAASRSEAT